MLECEFVKKGSGIIEHSYGYFHSQIQIITEARNLSEMYKTMIDTILEKIDLFQNQGSGWQFKKVNNLDLHIDNYQAIGAMSFIELPQKRKDNQCFKWPVSSCIFPAKKNPNKITKLLKTNSEKLNWEGLEFPMKVDKIGIFEKNNPKYGVNVYGYKNDRVYPIRIIQ